jgi:hypothetical protein
MSSPIDVGQTIAFLWSVSPPHLQAALPGRFFRAKSASFLRYLTTHLGVAAVAESSFFHM